MHRRRMAVYLLIPLILAAALILLAGFIARSRSKAYYSMPDLAIRVYTDPRETDAFAPNKYITYQIYYINQGGYVANDVRIVATLPEDTTVVSSSQPGFVLIQAGPYQVVWVRDRLSVFERGWLSFTVRVRDDAPVGARRETTAYILCLDPESNYDNNESILTHFIRPEEADLRVTKHLWQNSDPVTATNEIVYEIIPENWGGSPANSVRLTDTLPTDCTYVSDNTAVSGFTTVQTDTTVVWTVDSMPPTREHAHPRAAPKLYVHCQIAADWTADQWLENVVEISTTDPEYGYDNNLSRWTYKPEGHRRYSAAVTSVDDRTMRLLSDGGFDYALHYLDWSDVEPSDNQYDWYVLDNAVWQAWRHNLRLVVRVYRAPDWARGPGTDTAPPSNPAKLGEFLQAVAARWPRLPGDPDRAQIYGYVIWNEPNLAAEWGGNAPSATAYTTLLQAAYNGVKAGSANAWVISAGLAPTAQDPGVSEDDLAYLQDMYDAGAASYFDYLGANPMGFAYAPDDTSDPNGYNFARAEDWRAIMVGNGDGDKAMFGTETGWLRDTPLDLGNDYNWMKVSGIDQAHYLARAYHKAQCEWLRGDGTNWMGPLTTWNLDFATGKYSATDHEYWFGVTDDNGDPLRSYLTLQNAATRGPADLWLEKELIDPLEPGEEFRYVIRYTNIGGQTANGVTLTDTLPVGGEYVSDSGGGVLQPGGDQVVWSVGDVYTCTYEAITLTLRLVGSDPATAMLHNRVEANAMPGEPYTDDNVATIASPLPDLLAIQKTVTPSIVGPGQPLAYTLLFSNAGEITATSVIIADIVPVSQGLTAIGYAHTGAQITPTGSVSYTWEVEDLSPGEAGVITITGVVSPGVSGVYSLENRATISTTSTDLYWPNDASVVSNTVDAEAPGPPPLSSPADGAATKDNTPALTWNPSPSADAAGYLLDFDGAIEDVGEVTQVIINVLADGTYTWTVAAYDVVDNTSAFTDTWSFTVDTDPPLPPTLISPTDAITIATNVPTLAWDLSPSADAAGYLLDLDSSVQDVGNVTQTVTGTLDEGAHTWTVATYDAAGNSTYTDTWSFIVDTIPPPPVLLSPADGATINEVTPTLTWTACPCADIAGYLLDFDGTAHDVGNTTQYTTTILADDTYTWTVAAYDATGHTSAFTATWAFTVDTGLPLPPALLSPADTTLTDTTSLTLTWQASPSADVAGYLLDFDGLVQDVGNTTSFTTGLLADGAYTWTVAAYDGAGNTSTYTDTWSFTVDTIPPPPVLLSPADGTVTADVTPTLTWSASPSPDIDGYRLNLYGTEYNLSNTTQYTTSILADGTYTWTVAARDATGHVSAYTDTWSFTVDTQPPEPPALQSPADGVTIPTYIATMTWQASPSADVAGYLLALDGVVFDVGYTTQYTNATLANGTYTWTVAAYDTASNTGAYTDTWSFTVDATPLPPELLSPAEGTTIADDTPMLTWNPSPSPGVTGYLLGWQGMAHDVGLATQYTTTILAEDVYTWTVAAYNGLGQISDFTDRWTFIVDTTPPATATLESPADGTLTSTTGLTLTWQASTSPDVAGYLLDLAGTVHDVGNTTQYTTGVLPDDTYTWTVAAYDAVSNTSAYTGTWSFTVDTTPPVLPNLTSPADGTLTDTTSLTLTWQASPSPDASGYLLDFDATVQDVGDTTWFTTGVLADGTYTWTLAVYDALSNTSAFTGTWTFTIDTTTPDPPLLLSPTNGISIALNTPTLAWDPSPSPDVAGYLLDLGGTVQDVGHTTHYTTSILPDDTYTWTVAAYDALRHTSAYTDAWSFTIDTTLPAPPALTGPADGTLTDTTSLTLTWQASVSTDAAGYLLSFDGTVHNVGNTNWFTTGVLSDATYLWTAAAYDALSNTSAFTDTWSFTIDTVSPAPPVPGNPPHGAVIADNTPTLAWQAGPSLHAISPTNDVAGYLLDFDGTVQDVGNVTEYTNHILADDTYTWTVAAYDALGHTSAYAGIVSFTVDTVAPAIVAVAPADDEKEVGITAPVLITFSRPIEASTFAFAASPDPGGWSVSWDDGETRVTLTHAPFGYLRTYHLTVTTASDPLGNPLAGAPYAWSFVTGPYRSYLPLVLKGSLRAPDLVVERIVATTGGLLVAVKNQGDAPAVDDFWVDLYVDPEPVPSGVNQIWPDLADQGLVWGVTADLSPGEVLTLTVGSAYYVDEYSQVTWPLETSTPVYVQVDSASADATYGAVLEGHERTGGLYNNIGGPAYPTPADNEGAAEAPVQEDSPPGPAHRLPPRRQIGREQP